MGDGAAIAISVITGVSANFLAVLVFIRQGRQSNNIEKIHKATNSMHAALVKGARIAGFKAGRAQRKKVHGGKALKRRR